MQKFLFTGIICLIILFALGCGGNRSGTGPNVDTSQNNINNNASLNYDEVRTLLTDYVNATNDLNKIIVPGADGKIVGKALTDYTAKMKDFSPKLKGLTSGHPDFINNPPEDFKQLVMDYKGTAETFKTIFTNLVPFMQDPVVVQAIQDMQFMNK